MRPIPSPGQILCQRCRVPYSGQGDYRCGLDLKSTRARAGTWMARARLDGLLQGSRGSRAEMSSRDEPGTSFPIPNGSATRKGNDVGSPEDVLSRGSNAYQTLIEQIPAATHLSRLDHVSSTIYISPQIEAMTGHHPSEWIVDRDLWARSLHPDDRERVIAANARHITTGEPFCEEYRLVTRAGLITWVREEARILMDEHGKPIASQGVILDITHDKSVQEELKESAEVRRRLTRELAGAKAETGVEALLAALNAHDGYPGEHSQAVINLVQLVR
jgi:PAS domain S-box-containing protein